MPRRKSRRPEVPGCPGLTALGRFRVPSIPEPLVRGLFAWSQGVRPAVLLRQAPSVDEMLRIQAQGRRYVSLLSDDQVKRLKVRHADGLAFALHDLEHLEKFVQPGPL